MISEVIEEERESLPTHVSLCSQRYKELHDRVTAVENKIDEVSDKIENYVKGFKTTAWKVTGTIVVALIGATATILAAIINHPIK